MPGMLSQDELDADKATFDDTQTGKVDDTPAPPANAQPEEPVDAPDLEPDPLITQARDDKGKFLPKAEDDGKQRMVSHGALHKEREARKAESEAHKLTKAELEAAQGTLNQLAELRAKIATPKAPEEPVSDQPGDDDGVEHLKARIAQLETGRQTDEQQRQLAGVADAEVRTVGAHLTASEAAFRSQKPDYNDAVAHLVTARARELSRYGYDPATVQETLRTEAFEMTRAAIQLGRDPAEFAYETAQDRGYVSQRRAPDMLDAITAGQRTRSLGGAGGASPQGQVNANAMGNMSEEEFLSAYENNPEFRALADRLG